MLEKMLGYKFKDPRLLETALSHSSFANESHVASNERLEFLGDSIVGLVVTRMLYDKYPEQPEGVLSKIRGAIVCGANFARLAKELGIDRAILLGKGEEQSGGREKESNLAGAFEAVLGAIYLDGGFNKTYKVIAGIVNGCFESAEIFSDWKTELQELSQKEFRGIPRYKVVRDEGPPHAKLFYVEVRVAKRVVGRGSGKSKKEAEQAAAKEGLEEIKRVISSGRK